MLPTHISVADFSAAHLCNLSAQHGFDLRFIGDAPAVRDTVFQGWLEERQIRQGLTLVCSDIHIAHGYETRSVRAGQHFSIAALLSGQASLHVARQHTLLTTGHAVNMLFDDQQCLQSIHKPNQHVRGVNVTVEVPEATGDDALAQLLYQTLARQLAQPLRQQQPLPPHLRLSIEHILAGRWQGALAALEQEALSLQLLAYALAPANALDASRAPSHRLTPRDRLLLARVRDRLQDEPGGKHRLDALAQLACMSPTTLCEKFRLAYGHSIFACLRELRMQKAHDMLVQGWSVQQAAHFVGYAHASNFATAFRARFGLPPSQMVGRKSTLADFRHRS